MSWRRSLAVALSSLILAACSVSTERNAQVLTGDQVPFSLLEPDAPPMVPGPTTENTDTVNLCFVRDGQLVVVEQPLADPVRLLDSVRALSRPIAAAGGPTRTALSDPSLVEDVVLTGGVARVRLQRSVSELGGDNQLLAVAQIVCTLTGRPGVGQVSFTLEGSPVDVPRGDGSVVSQPVARDDYAGLMREPA